MEITSLGYLEEFWRDMVRPYLNLRTRRRIAQTSTFHQKLESAVPPFMKKLYELYGTNVERLWRLVEVWEIVLPYMLTSTPKVSSKVKTSNMTMIYWRRGKLSGPKMIIRYYFDRTSIIWRLELSRDRSTKRVIYTIEEQDEDILCYLLSIKDDSEAMIVAEKIRENAPSQWIVKTK